MYRHRAPPLQLDLDHTEQILHTFSAVTIGPYKNALFYFFPFISAFCSSHIEMRANDPAQEAMMPSQAKALILREIRDLTQAAGIKRAIVSYTALNHAFSNSGGSLSLTKPALFIPHQHLFRAGKSPFGQETPQDNLSADLWNFSDDETRFLISRELGHIKKSDALLRIAMKVALIASLFIFYATPIGWFAGAAVMAAPIGLYLISERCFEARMDQIGIDIAARSLENRKRASGAAVNALEKMRLQNLARREHSALCRLYITKSGNNLLDLNHPFLSSRIKRLLP